MTSIGKNAFASCGRLTSVTIPNSVTDIVELAFFNCPKLPSVTIPSSVKNIGSRVFFGCSGLTSLQVESGNTVYDSRENCNAIIETASNTLIAGCQNTMIPYGVTSIGDYAFYECTELTAITIPKSVTSIGISAFSNCYKLTSVRIPDGVTSVGDFAFAGCWEVDTVIIPNSMKSIGKLAFNETMKLRELYCYAEQVPETGNKVFDYSHRGATLHVPAASISAYQAVEPWKSFKEIVALEEQMAYRPMIEEGKVWKVVDITSGNPAQCVEYYYFDGDTIFDGRTCKQMMCQLCINPDYAESHFTSMPPLLSYIGAWYEEDRKVYFCNATDNQFKLMYDFSIEANDTLEIDNHPYLYVIGPRQTGGISGFKGVYRDVWECIDGEHIYRCAPWLEGVGIIYGPPTLNVFNVELGDPRCFLMSCTVGDEVIYYDSEEDDPYVMGARKRFDFTHTIKTQPQAPRMAMGTQASSSAEAEQSLYGKYNNLQLDINLAPLDDAYLVRITDVTGTAVYEKTVNAASIVGLNIDISAYAEGRYTVTVENSLEIFTGEFVVQTTGIGDTLRRNDNGEITNDNIYNLQGQRISTLQKGLNIVNGQKLFVK